MKQSDSNMVLMAAVLGFAAGLLFAPRSGPETREILKIQAEDAKARVRNAADELKRQTDEGATTVKDTAEAVKQKTKVAKDTVTKHAAEANTELKNKM